MVPSATPASRATSRICTASYPPSAASFIAASMTRWRRAAWLGVSASTSSSTAITPLSPSRAPALLRRSAKPPPPPKRRHAGEQPGDLGEPVVELGRRAPVHVDRLTGGIGDLVHRPAQRLAVRTGVGGTLDPRRHRLRLPTRTDVGADA